MRGRGLMLVAGMRAGERRAEANQAQQQQAQQAQAQAYQQGAQAQAAKAPAAPAKDVTAELQKLGRTPQLRGFKRSRVRGSKTKTPSLTPPPFFFGKTNTQLF